MLTLEAEVAMTMDTVLIVEDSRAMQRTLQRLFEADSLQVQLASDGPDGLEQFRKQLPCAVVLDLKLPGISGKELCREFKSIASSVPIVGSAPAPGRAKFCCWSSAPTTIIALSVQRLLARVRRAVRHTAAPRRSLQFH